MKRSFFLTAVLLTSLLGKADAQQTIAPTVSSIPVIWDTNTTVANGTIPILLPPWKGGGRVIYGDDQYWRNPG